MGVLEVIRDKDAMRCWSRTCHRAGKQIALVPTMGCLHLGHLSLVEEAKRQADYVVVSIYVNPGQFAPGEDLQSYPRDLEGDLQKLEQLGIDKVFSPYDLYGGGTENYENNSCVPGHQTWIRVEELEKPLCGQNRPIFFRGVATVVAKLFNIVEPDLAIFGKKDYQQLRIICQMVHDLDFAVKIVGMPLVRESDGLAMSSRNLRLSPEERQKALSINTALQYIEMAVSHGETNAHVLTNHVKSSIANAGGKVDYAVIVDQQSLQEVDKVYSGTLCAIAAWFGNVRLLDNIEFSSGDCHFQTQHKLFA